MTTISSQEFVLLARYVAEQSGIVLGENKTYLVEGRLGRLLETTGCRTYADLIRKAKADPSARLRVEIVDAITTNETSFFRDLRPFELLAHKLVPSHFERTGKKRLSIWCAASSTGQEIYSIAIVLKEVLGDLDHWDLSILGTDISEGVLQAASRGVYSKLDVSRGLTVERLNRHFTREEAGFRISDELRALARFEKLNLVGSLAAIGTFDIVFCRNVAIYFAEDTRDTLFERVSEHIGVGGALVIGSTEVMQTPSARLARREHHRAVYWERV